jgi:hypothetical protein
MSIDELNRTNKRAPLQTETDAIVSQLSQSLPQLYERCWYFHLDKGWQELIKGGIIPLLANEQYPGFVQNDERMMKLMHAGILKFTKKMKGLWNSRLHLPNDTSANGFTVSNRVPMTFQTFWI